MRTNLELNANIIELVGKKSDSQQQGQAQPAQQSQPRQNAPAANRQPAAPADNFDAPYDDDIPF